ncbi:amidase [Erwinia sp. HDF1-3R]|uniref:amidase n=1 Tax=Erwinia sp. HDF1-3R TaxID=3141543 RepID=UPI0031F512AA
MKLSEYTEFDAVGLAALISRGEVKACEVKTAALAAIAAVNPELKAVIECWPEAESSRQGALRGVPILIKDLGITEKGRRNELGSRLAEGMIASEDSNLMQRMKQSGLVVLGRTTTPELAASTTTEPRFNGGTRNPWNLAFSAGGSSGGSAVAVASGMVPAAHATDGGGSVRVPASVNGLFGVKPSRGRISMGPAVDEVWSGLAVHGFITRSVRDSAALMDAMHGAFAGDPFQISPPRESFALSAKTNPGRLRIGVMERPLNNSPCSSEVIHSLEKTISRLASLGHHIESVTPDIGLSWEAFVEMNARFWATNTAVWIDGLASVTQRAINSDTLEASSLALYALGRSLTASDLSGAMHMRNTVTRKMGLFFQQYDLLLTPTLPHLPLKLGSYNANQRESEGREWMHHVFNQSPFTALANICGTPAMSVPSDISEGLNLPVGMQFFAAFGGESLLYNLAGQLERAFPWQLTKPSVWAGH